MKTNQPSGKRKGATDRSRAVVARAGGRCPIVGIGASAGGLEAFTQLLKQLPLDTGFGFVLVQHLDPQHESALTQLLTRATAMPVHEVTNNLRVVANHVYIIPPNTNLGISRGVLILRPRPADRTAPRSIDFFFEALAIDQRERAIGVILSGAATDGTLGLEAIKAEGGLTFAQDGSARYDSMPRSAVAAGCVDFVLSPQKIAKELARIARHPYVAGRTTGIPGGPNGKRGAKRQPGDARGPAQITGRKAVTDATETDAAGTIEEVGYKRILLLLRNHCGVDFSLYKTSTIRRRIQRRAVLNRSDTLEDYAVFLRGNAKELDALYSDTLIGVTSFFRNADAFAVLRHRVLPELLRQRGDDPLRVWVLGCSTGQEPYSIAMAYAEAAGKISRPRKLQIFATDLNEANLHKARNGLYARSQIEDVSPERLKRFFVEEDGGFRIIRSLRESVVFARQNVISDPPFSRMDLISCRNLMIYFEPSLQKKVLPTFHYALKPEGFLFLGASESVGGFTDLFQAVDKKQKIFSKRAAPARAFQLPLHQERGERPRTGAAPSAVLALRRKQGGALDAVRVELNAEREADRVTVNQFAPPGVLINGNLQILQFRGPTGAYLEPATGKASFDLLKMAREGLMLPLRAVIHRAASENKSARQENVPVSDNGQTRLVNIEVVPLKNLKERCFLVLFEDAEQRADASGAESPPGGAVGTARASRAAKREDSSRIVDLERDLAEARDYQQSIQEHQESANEELQASNEEGQSANEELQSLNEELETSKEELESTNEELTTVNEEMVSRNSDLTRLNADLTNLQTATRFVIVLLGRDLTIRRYSSEAERQFGLHASDLGRPIGGIRHNLHVPDLNAVIAKVIAGGREDEREVQDLAGRWYSLRVRPYLAGDGRVDGAVLVLVDIDDLKRTEQLITEAHEHAEAIIRTVPNPLVTLTTDLRVQTTNDAFNRTFKVSPKEMIGCSIFEIDHGAWDTPRLRHLLKNVIPYNSFFNEFELTHDFERIGRRSLLLNARVLNEPGGKAKEILLGIQDVTAVVAFQADLRRSEMRYRRLFEAAQDGILILDPTTRKITDANPYIVNLLGRSRKQLIRKELWQIGLLKDEAANRDVFRELKAKGFLRMEDLTLKSADGRHHEVEFVSNLYDEDGGEVIQCNIRDITKRKLAELAANRLVAIVEFSDDAIIGKDLNGIITSWNRGAEKIFGFTAREMVGTSIFRLVPADRRTEEEDILRKIGAGQSVQHFETRRRTKNKGLIDVSVTVSPILDIAGNVIGISNVARDISERRQVEAALRDARAKLAKYAGQLEGMVAARTAQLTATNQRLAVSVATIRKTQEEYRALFLASQVMQKKLRHLTRQIITTQEEERKQISRELHDEVVQTLIAINVELAALGEGAELGGRALQAKIAHTQRLVETSVHAVHRFARGLRPAVLDDLGLIAALHAHCKHLAAQKKIAIKLTAFRGADALGGAERTVLFRVAQEALTNVVRHAHATHVRIVISKVAKAIRMEVSDNGRSFAVEKMLQKGNNKRLGLVGMRERVEMVGGTLKIESTRGTGTTVRAELPFEASTSG